MSEGDKTPFSQSAEQHFPPGLSDYPPSSEDSGYYHHSGSGFPDSDSESSEEGDPLADGYMRKGNSYNAFDFLTAGSDPAMNPDYLLSCLQRSGGAEDHEEEPKDMDDEEVSKAPDPGPFRYNKRLFITALPCILLILTMTGETLLVIMSVGGLVIALMTQMGEEMSKRCVVAFALLFIPCHILIIGTVLPLIWLSWWNVLLVGIVNMFVILTGGWIIIQFVAFRREEASMCVMIEHLLFAYYPLVCCALVTWVMSTVMSPVLIPFVFISLWFVCLQLYLLPASSSFAVAESSEDDRSILSPKTVIPLVASFIVSGPLLHVVWAVSGTMAVFSAFSMVLFTLLLCLGVFLSTLLGLRHLCDHLGLPHALPGYLRWASGGGLLVLSYPVLQHLGMMSHFLVSLPAAIAGFTALGVTLSLKKNKIPSLGLALGLMLLLCVWLLHLPWSLSYNLLGVVSLRLFFLLVAGNFVLCVLTIYTAWHSTLEVFGLVLLLQAAAVVVCEMGLYQAGLYSLPTLQLTGLAAAYTFYRLHGAGKLLRNVAALASALHLTKTLAASMGYLLKGDKDAGGAVVVEFTPVGFLTLLLFVGMVVWLFVYETKEEVSFLQAGKHLALLLISLAVSAQSFLLPIGQLMLDDPALADLVGLWYVAGGMLVMLYALQHSYCERLLDELVKVSFVLAGTGVIVMVMQPQFAFSLVTGYQWSEVLSILLIAALLVTGVTMGFTQILATASVLGIAPGIHATLLLYDQPTLLHFVLLCILTCILLSFLLLVCKLDNIPSAADMYIKLGTMATFGLLIALISVDIVSLETEHFYSYNAWKAAFGVATLVSLCLKSLSMKLGPRLPILRRENELLPALPLFGNLATILAFLLARTQGPQDGLLHDLWCCAAALILILLQRDALLFPSLSPSNRATPTVFAAVGTMVLSSLLHSRLWQFSGAGSIFLGFFEVACILGSLPVYVVLVGIMWSGTVWSEKAVVFLLPLNALIFLLASSYTGWVLALCGVLCGAGMMALKLPLLPDCVAHR